MWALALCVGLIFALILGLGTRSDMRPKGHFVSIFYFLIGFLLFLDSSLQLKLPFLKDGAY